MIFNENQIEEFREQCIQCFQKYGKNQTGVLEYTELKILLIDIAKESGTPIPTDEDVEKVFHDSDRDRDRKLSKEEFVELYKVIYIMKKRLYL